MQVQANWENHLLDLAGQIPILTRAPSFPTGPGMSLYRKLTSRPRGLRQSIASHLLLLLLCSPKINGRLYAPSMPSAVRWMISWMNLQMPSVNSQLDYWRSMIETASFDAGDLVAAAWADTLTRYHIPRHYAMQLIDGVARDLVQSRYQTFEELATYCYGVASTVGLMSMHIVGFRTPKAVPYAIKLGVALQMTNILRDVGEDYRNGRLYLPREELAFYGIPESDIAVGRITDNWRQFMKFQIERTRQLYVESWEGVKLLEREGQLAIGAASVFYQGILDEIEKNDYDVFTRRASLSALGKVSRIPSLWLKVKTLQ